MPVAAAVPVFLADAYRHDTRATAVPGSCEVFYFCGESGVDLCSYPRWFLVGDATCIAGIDRVCLRDQINVSSGVSWR